MEEVVAITVVGNSGILVVIERYVGIESLYNELISVNLATRTAGYRIQIYNSVWVIVNNTNSSTILYSKIKGRIHTWDTFIFSLFFIWSACVTLSENNMYKSFNIDKVITTWSGLEKGITF